MPKKKSGYDCFVDVNEVHKYYQMGNTTVKALRGVDVEVEKGDFIFIVGPSGSGKSTLMHIIGALDHPSKGNVIIGGLKVSELDDWQLSMVRRNKVGFIFQSFNLVLSLTALENVILPMQTSGENPIKLEARARTLLKEVGLGDRMEHTPNELSGGERQRVAIARALINDPEIILADEPTGNLDSKIGKEIFELMRKMNKENNTTFIIVTHDTEYITRGDKVYHIKDGVIIENYKEDGKFKHYNSRKKKN